MSKPMGALALVDIFFSEFFFPRKGWESWYFANFIAVLFSILMIGLSSSKLLKFYEKQLSRHLCKILEKRWERVLPGWKSKFRYRLVSPQFTYKLQTAERLSANEKDLDLHSTARKHSLQTKALGWDFSALREPGNKPKLSYQQPIGLSAVPTLGHFNYIHGNWTFHLLLHL